MAAFPSLVLTNAGVTLQNKVQGGATLEFTNIQMGSGQLNGQPIGPMTALISPNATVPIQGGQAIGQNTYQVEGFFTNADLSAGFWWREIGIFANDPDNGEILYAYANAGDAGDYIPTVTDQRIEKYIYFSMALANATTVNVTIPQTDTYVLRSTIGQANGVAGLDENGAVPIEQGGTGATTTQAALAALGVLSALVTAAAYNPSGTYAVGDYCTYSGNLYVCNTAIPGGEAWTAEHWTETSVAAELAEVRASLSNLDVSKVQISNLSGVDLNEITTDGHYRLSGECTNVPITGGGWEQWTQLLVITGTYSDNTTQIMPIYWDGTIWVRTIKAPGTWTEWSRLATATLPQEHAIVPKNGASLIGDYKNSYFKDQFGRVTVYFSFSFGSVPENNSEIFSLPQSFTPSGGTAVGTAVLSTGVYYPALVYANPNGMVTVGHNITDHSGPINLHGFLIIETGGAQ